MDNQVGILDTLDSLLQTERTFYQSVRILGANRAETVIETHQRNTAVLLGIIRSYMAVESPLYSVRYNVTVPSTLPPGWNDPVVVHATSEQISAATETGVSFHDENCAICQETITTPATRIRHCGHIFHPNCISEWFSRSVHCPNCRHDIRNWTFDNTTVLPTLPLPRSPPLVRRRGVILTTDPPLPTSSAQVHTPPPASTQSALLSEVANEIPHIEETASSDEHRA
jgi:hypothetical protein